MWRKKLKRIDHETEMSFIDHLGELRNRLIVCIGAIVLTTMFIGLPLSNQFVRLLMRPLQGVEIERTELPLTLQFAADGVARAKDMEALVAAVEGGELSKFRMRFEFSGAKDKSGNPLVFDFGPEAQSDLYFLGPFDLPFLIMKAALLLGIALAIPVWLTQLWRFVSPAFTPAELRAVRPVFFSAVFLFPIGAAFAYFGIGFMLEAVFNTFKIPGLEPRLEAGRYFSMLLMFMFIFGIIFELPVVVVLLVRTGVVKTSFLRATRRYAILVIAILSAVLTPADPFSMMMMAIPLWVLYEASIWISVAIERRIEAESKEEQLLKDAS